MPSAAFQVFERLLEQVQAVEDIATREESSGNIEGASILRRSAYVLAIASIDTYFHEYVTEKLVFHGGSNPKVVASFVGIEPSIASGPTAEGNIRLHLSYKTFVAPGKIDTALTACGYDPEAVWRDAAIERGTRPDRLRTQLQVLYDRRNEIAHAGDWDTVQLCFRAMERTHLTDCVRFLTDLTEAMEKVL